MSNETLRKLRQEAINFYRGGDGWFTYVGRENGYGLTPWIRSDYTNEGAVLNESNFESILARLQSVDSRTRTFHMSGFSVQGIDHIEVPLTLAIANEVEAIIRALEQYPVLDEMDYSEREYQDAHAVLERYGVPSEHIHNVWAELFDSFSVCSSDEYTVEMVSEAMTALDIKVEV